MRPEYVTLAAPNAAGAVAVTVTQAQDIGTYWLVTATVAGSDAVVRARLSPDQPVPKAGEAAWFGVVGRHTCFYKNEELVA